jgi:hypothetical protein
MAKADTGKFDSASDPAHRRQIVLNTWVTLFLLWEEVTWWLWEGCWVMDEGCSFRRGSHGRPQPLNGARFSGFRASGRTRVSFTSVRVRPAARSCGSAFAAACCSVFRFRRCRAAIPRRQCKRASFQAGAGASTARSKATCGEPAWAVVGSTIQDTSLLASQIVSEPPLGLVWLQGTAKLYSVHVLLLFCSTSGRECCNAPQLKPVDRSGW